jgi:hypothetical protein
MGIDPIAAGFAQQSVREAETRSKAALVKYDEESIRVRESSDKFYGSLALFSGGTIALSITYLGYLKGSTPGRLVLYPRVLIAAWICLLVCATASLFCPLLNSYYAHFGRLRVYVNSLVQQNQTYVDEIDNMPVIDLTTPEEKQQYKERLRGKVEARTEDLKWAKKRESISSALWSVFGWVARLSFPVGLGMLTFFATKNM